MQLSKEERRYLLEVLRKRKTIVSVQMSRSKAQAYRDESAKIDALREKLLNLGAL